VTGILRVAKQLERVAVQVRDRRAGEAEEPGVRQRRAQVLAQLLLLGPVRLVDQDDDVVPVVQQAGVLKLVDGGEDQPPLVRLQRRT